MRIDTVGAKEWLSVLKLHWNIAHTQIRNNEDDILVMHFGKSSNLVVAHYSRITMKGYVNDRRKEIR